MRKYIISGILLLVLGYSVFGYTKPTDWKPSTKTVTALQKAGATAGLPIGLAECVAYSESRFTPWAVSVKNSRGLMQISAKYEIYLADRFFPGGHKAFRWWNASDSATLGCNYLAFLIDYYGGSIYLGLLSYCWGPTNLTNIKSWDDVPDDAIYYANQILSQLDTFY